MNKPYHSGKHEMKKHHSKHHSGHHSEMHSRHPGHQGGFTHETGLQDVQDGHGHPAAHVALENYRHKMDAKVGKHHVQEVGYHKD
jgi:hypothetical protein